MDRKRSGTFVRYTHIDNGEDAGRSIDTTKTLVQVVGEGGEMGQSQIKVILRLPDTTTFLTSALMSAVPLRASRVLQVPVSVDLFGSRYRRV